MIAREHVPLSTLTTLRVGGLTRYVLECANEDDVREAVLFAQSKDLPWYVLGEGSNMLASDEGYAGAIIRIKASGFVVEEKDDYVFVAAAAGTPWDGFVTDMAKRGLWGIENLAGIPGTVGASPVQNIGAYGMEVKDTIVSVRVFDTKDGTFNTLDASECAFGYRDSCFKHDSSLIILSVTFALTANGIPQISYKDLALANERGEDLSCPEAIGTVVRRIRAKKFPDVSLHGTAGSFFKNPVITSELFNALAQVHAGIPGYETENGIKVPLAFVLDQILGLRGYTKGNVSLFENQPLVLVTRAGATATEVDAFANDIAVRVQEKTSISIEREVRSLA